MTKEQKISKENCHILKNGKCHGFEEVEVSAGDRVSSHSPADCLDNPHQKETELTPEMDNLLQMIPWFLGKLNEVPGKNLFTFEFLVKAMQAIKKETEQSLKQKVEKMLEGMIKENEQTPPADKEEEIDERAYRQALEEAKNKLKDL